MPRKGAATAAPPAPAEEPEVTAQTEVTGEDLPGPGAEDKPKRGGRKTREEVAEEKAAEDKAIEDWTRPAYADSPGEFEFDMLDDGDEYYRVLWFGVEGTGKTTDLAMVTRIAPKGRVLMINAESGAKRRPLTHHGVDTSRIATYPPKGQQLTFEGLERLFYRVQADLAEDPNSWAAVGWDSITAIYQKLLDDVIEADIRKQAEILQRAGKGRAGRSGNITLRDRFETDRDDYASMSNQVRLLLRKYRSLHCHLLITALERRDDVGKGTDKHPEFGPAISPALSVDLLGYMDVVLHTYVTDTGVFVGRSQPTEDTRGKDRMNALPIEMVDPTIERVHQYVSGELAEGSDLAQEMLPDREVMTRRRSLADGYGVYHTADGTKDGPPLAGDEDDPEPPKRSARRRAAVSSGRTSASAPKSAPEEPADSEPESPATEPKPAAEESPKASGRRARGTTSAAAADSTADKPSGRKTAAQRREEAARAEMVKDGVADETPKRGGRKPRGAADKSEPSGGFEGEPPF